MLQMKNTNVTTAKALEILGVSRMTLHRYIDNGMLQVAEKIGKDNFFSEDDIFALLPTLKKKQKIFAPKEAEKKIKQHKEKQEKAEKKEKQIQETMKKSDDEILNNDGKIALDLLTREMTELGTLKEIDKLLIFQAAVAYQLSHEYTKLSISIQFTSFDIKGGEKKHHYSQVAKEHFDRYLTICKELGLTPMARNKLAPKEETPIDEMDGLLA